MNRIALTVIILLILGGLVYFCYANFWKTPEFADENRPLPLGMEAVTQGSAKAEEEELLPTDISTIIDPSKSVPVETIPESLTVLVNRAFLLPESYEPKDLVKPDIEFDTTVVSDKNYLRKVAATALEKMVKEAKKKKLKIIGVSGYRSYARQKQVYNQSAATNGKSHADKYCAVPGSSEHQTGLSIDVSSPDVKNALQPSFASTKESKWIEKNAHRFGYVVRYPKKKQKITGYNYEPWHLRYVGPKVAAYLYENELTLEEYYNVSMNKENKEWRNDL